jgi:hypothetical protein
MKRKSMSRSPYRSNKNIFHHFNLSGHWEEKCLRLHPELHPRHRTTKRRVWRVKTMEDEERYTSPIQEVEVVSAEIEAREEMETTKTENRLMTRANTF